MLQNSIFQKTLFWKAVTIGALTLALLIPLSMIEGLVAERANYLAAARTDIRQSWTGEQTVSGPILAFPYVLTVVRSEEISEYGKTRTVTREDRSEGIRYVLPDTLSVAGTVETEQRRRGIHSVPVYTASMSLNGEFAVPPARILLPKTGTVVWGRPFAILSMSDVRGIRGDVKMTVGGAALAVEPGTNGGPRKAGIHGLVDMTPGDAEQRRAFSVAIDLNGMESLYFIPVGRRTDVTLKSSWPHPSFKGLLLPRTRDVSDAGFDAKWETSFLANGIRDQFDRCAEHFQCGDLLGNRFGVALMRGVDVYLMSERAVKYAILFIAITFVAFFLFEVMKSLRIHPVQYGLVGVALALFFLLLLSLSEHLDFALAYTLAAAACVAQLSFYVGYVLRSAVRGLLFGSGVGVLYGALFMLLRSEGQALLMGSLLLFAVLAAVMVATRRIDWYSVGLPRQEPVTPAADTSAR